MNSPRLGVNIDHVATLRQQRDEDYPSIGRAAELVLRAGADQITIHLREDRRHIQDKDLLPVKEACVHAKKLFNLEMGSTPEMNTIAARVKPDWVCLVPESRAEKTTEGGLNLKNSEVFARVGQSLSYLAKHSPQTKISLFVEADLKVLELCHKLGAHAVEIHTGSYAQDFLQGKSLDPHFSKYREAKSFLEAAKIGCHAGHGLTDLSLKPLCEHHFFQEYNIGHWIVSEAVFIGLEAVIKRLKEILKG